MSAGILVEGASRGKVFNTGTSYLHTIEFAAGWTPSSFLAGGPDFEAVVPTERTTYTLREVAFAGRRFRSWQRDGVEGRPEEVISALIDAHPDDVRRVEVPR